jgi:hypothetical protein
MAHITVQQVVDHFAGVEGMPFPANSQVNGIYAEVGRTSPFTGQQLWPCGGVATGLSVLSKTFIKFIQRRLYDRRTDRSTHE